MKIIQWVAGLILSFSLLVIIFITSFQVAMYSDFDWYQRTYERYHVLADLDMEMEDVMYVTREMMAYLIGEREDLFVTTKIGGEAKNFFGYQDRFHMFEVKELFLGGLEIRSIATDIFLVSLLVLILTRVDYKKVIPRSLWISMGMIGLAGIALFLIFMFDFSHAFVVFHEIFFDNDLWLFDPATSYMIRMLPEGLFYDMIMRVLLIFGIGLVVLLAASIFFHKLTWNKNQQAIITSTDKTT